MRLLARKAIGRVKRAVTRIPKQPVLRSIGGVMFEHAPAPFLDRDDFRAMLTGTYDLSLCDFLRRSLRPGDVFVDVGASVGYVSAVAASIVGKKGAVHAFEPNPTVFRALERLRELNPEHEIVLNNCALGDTVEMAQLSYDPKDTREGTLLKGAGFSASDAVFVMRLDDYLASVEIWPRVIKIDVEGYELPVLRGAARLINVCQPLIVCEIKPWELKKLDATMEDFARFVYGLGYIGSDLVTGKRVDLAGLTEYANVVLTP